MCLVYGVCYGLAAGDVNITMIVSRWDSGVLIGSRTAASRLFIDEILHDASSDGKQIQSCHVMLVTE